MSVTFTEPIDPASVTPASFRALTGGTTVAGSFTFLNGNRVARFTPAAGWPFEAVVVAELTGAIVDAAGNALVTSAGQPVTSPITFTFLTGNFAITSPAGSDVIERTAITLPPQASAALEPDSVVFSVNGTALPAVDGSAVQHRLHRARQTPAPTLTIVASARNAQNAEIARAEKVVTVSGGLTASPTILGVARGATGTIATSRLPNRPQADRGDRAGRRRSGGRHARRHASDAPGWRNACRRRGDGVLHLPVGSRRGRQGRRHDRASSRRRRAGPRSRSCR